MSDSASFDEVVELLVQSGRSLPHAVLMMIPEAWERSTFMSAERRDFYRYHAALMEPWDGPASITFCDGQVVGAVLDRNGLRPARYWVTKDQRVIFASEVGVLPVDPANIERKGRLQPGRVFLVDIGQGRIIEDSELKSDLAARAPYGEWLDEQQVSLDQIEAPAMLTPSHASIVRQQKSFGYSDEELRLIIRHMAQVSEEPIGSMGSDATVPALSNQPRVLFDYFTQLFAQVTTHRSMRSARNSSPRHASQSAARTICSPKRPGTVTRLCCRRQSSVSKSWPRSVTSKRATVSLALRPQCSTDSLRWLTGHSRARR